MAELKNFIVAREHQGDRLTETGFEVHRFEEGDIRVADPSIVANLVKLGILVDPDAGEGDTLRTDGPTIAEFVLAGYQADDYPPKGYASRSTDEEIAEYQRRQSDDRQHAEAAKAAAALDNKKEGDSTETKVDPPAENKTPVSPPPPAPTKTPAASKAPAKKTAAAVKTKAG